MEIEKWIFDIFEKEYLTFLKIQIPKEKYNEKESKILEKTVLETFKAQMNTTNPYLVDRGVDTQINRLKDVYISSGLVHALSFLLVKKNDVDEYKIKINSIPKEMRDGFIERDLHKYVPTVEGLNVNESLITVQNYTAAVNSTIQKALTKLGDRNLKREEWIAGYCYMVAVDLIKKVYNNHYSQAYINENFAFENMTHSLGYSLFHHRKFDDEQYQYGDLVNQIVTGNDFDYDKSLRKEKTPSFLKSLFGL